MHYTSFDQRKRANAAFLIGAYAVSTVAGAVFCEGRDPGPLEIQAEFSVALGAGEKSEQPGDRSAAWGQIWNGKCGPGTEGLSPLRFYFL